MPDLIFGITRKQFSTRAVRKLDRLCKERGGNGFTWAMFTEGPKGWFTAPNRGYPFDRELRLSVLDAVRKEGIEL